MGVKSIIEEIARDVQDVDDTDFTYYITKNVPSSEDPKLTFERGVEKKGKVIETCVLYADIRNSVDLTEKHHSKTMGKIYTAFIKAVLKVANYHNGFTRNIIGDRVMVVFPEKECFTNAVNCAVSINHISKNIINDVFRKVDFKCGIGIDYGKLRAIKVGVEKRGPERTDNKNLVWVGYPANIASRLTDMANKTTEEEYFEVKYNPINIGKILPPPLSVGRSLAELLGEVDKKKEEPLYLDRVVKKDLTPSEFAGKLSVYLDDRISFNPGKLTYAEKKNKNFTYKPILITNIVFQGFKKKNSNDSSFKNDWWVKQERKIRDITNDVFGADLTWKI